MEPTYDPGAVEADWYDRWEEAGIFTPEANPNGEPFSIVIPPPNVTGVLHIGHAFEHTIIDTIVRRRRMMGDAVLWLPGTDHAGIATQVVVERTLAEEGKSRHDLGREAFIDRVWEWKRTSGGQITRQMRLLGDSVDWTRERFTMDEGLSTAVRKVFVELYDQGVIYRGHRIINWCPQDHTALSDLEVNHIDSPGDLTYVRYRLADDSGHVVVATTRLETMLGDTAVAVHPDDERFQDLVGKTVVLPLQNREIPIVADEGVEPEFGTGAVKVTPAHDPLDFDIGTRAGLESIIIMDQDGKINESGGAFAGMDRFDARRAIRERLEAEGLVERVEDRVHAVGHCSRCDTIVEPLLSQQWFVKVEPLVGPAMEAVKQGEADFVPEQWENTYFRWMENLRDWCISRQLWWGHRIPAWYCSCGEVVVSQNEPTICPTCGSNDLIQDEDVLDTWFSSALWPFSTLGWPDETADLERFYPTSVLVTGYDIISFWVSRMLMMGVHFLPDVPFRTIVIHGMVRDEFHNKMSKSRNNTVDPLEVIEGHGADPLRLALLQAAGPGQDVPFSMDWVEGARKFGNKLWNAVRFVLNHTGAGSVPADAGYPDDPSPESAWILGRLGEVGERFDALSDEYRLADAYSMLYNFAWSEVFDWYIELSKALTDGPEADEVRATLGVVMRDVLKLFHPVIPFVTEELWKELVGDGFIASSAWPVVPPASVPPSMTTFQELVTGVRQFRATHGLSPRSELKLVIDDPNGVAEAWWDRQFLSLVSVVPTYGTDAPEGSTRIVAGSLTAYLPMEGIVDVALEKERLNKRIADEEDVVRKAGAKLTNADFVDKAPSAVVEKERGKLAEAEAKLASLRAQLVDLG
ncbi:MAG: valine--tRNA ligase [Acidimicrobiia bacterium]|nr:valine--tRNA ligase [Acidimicrobiia bacterium]